MNKTPKSDKKMRTRTARMGAGEKSNRPHPARVENCMQELFSKEPLHEQKELINFLFQFSTLPLGEFRKLIIRSGLVGQCLSADDAPVHNHPALSGALVEGDGFHASPAQRSAVAGTIGIDMLAPETGGTMISVRSLCERQHLFAAMLTDKLFLACDECHVRRIPAARSDIRHKYAIM